ncbi:hypothetical protein NPIL_16281 [Nephila pilipes]|uniref:Uncharacterized protein n=1 Tax=Nephila pilipes TaxID=299642 RepID=A0A8X6TLQ6_NEPPI|nr:hypothetical protein NPIL_16281 [Nephila pilipes]
MTALIEAIIYLWPQAGSLITSCFIKALQSEETLCKSGVLPFSLCMYVCGTSVCGSETSQISSREQEFKRSLISANPHSIHISMTINFLVMDSIDKLGLLAGRCYGA